MPHAKPTHAKHAPWALLPCILLTLSSTTLLARPHAARADAPKAAPSTAAAAPYDDGDGDELLEHWGDPKYSREERVQMAGMAGIAALLVPALLLARRGRTARKAGRI